MNEKSTSQETWYILNDCVLMHEGEFVANPFVMQYDIPPATIWVIENKERVLRIIRSVLKVNQYRYLPVNDMDCYERILHFFIFENNKQHFIPFVEGEIDLDAYCTMHLKNLIRNYIRELKPKQHEPTVMPFLQGEEVERGLGVSMDIIDAPSLYTTNIFDTETSELDITFNHLCEDYTEYFFSVRGYRPFDLEAYFTYMYFEVDSLDILKHLTNVASKLGVSVELLSLVSTGLRDDVTQKVREAESILGILKELITENKERGWKPPKLRSEAQ